jgi:hydrogenase maturation protease
MDCHLSATLKSLHQSILVIGYGNLLRSDDGVGQGIARAIAGWGMPNVEAIAVHQLTPELIERLVTVDITIFVDAYPVTATEQDIQICPLELARLGMTSGHWCEPQMLLAMMQALYGYHPQGWWVMVPGVHFELGECLSPIAQQGMDAALQEIEHLITSERLEPCTK